jgi:hypothetical protein
MRRPEAPHHPQAPRLRVKPLRRHRRPEARAGRQPAAQPLRQPARLRLRPRRDRIRRTPTRRARSLPPRIRIIRTRARATRIRAQIRMEPRLRPDRQIRVLPTQARIPGRRIQVPTQVRTAQARTAQVLPIQLRQIRRQGIRLRVRRRRVELAHRRSRNRRQDSRLSQSAGPRRARICCLTYRELSADGCCWVMQCVVPSPQTRSPEKMGTISRLGNSVARVFRATRSLGSLKTGTNTTPFAI